MNLRDVTRQLQANMLAGNAMILKGPPGFGKTDLMTKMAAWFKGQHPGKKIGFSCFFMATQTPIGFTGLPWKGERKYVKPDGTENTYTVTDPAIPGWYMATCLDTGQVLPANLFDYVFLVIEEWGQGSPETKRAGAEVLRAGGTPPFYLPQGSVRVALTNTDARDGVTKEFDFIIGRRGELTVTGDCDVWIEDFADKPYNWQGKTWQVLPVTKAWAKANPNILFEDKPKVQGPWCNPRSLTSCDRYVQMAAQINGGDIPHKDSGFVDSVAGHIGMAACVSFCSHLDFVLQLPKYEDVVADPAGTPVPSKADLQMLMAYELAGRTRNEHLAEVIQYVGRLPKDMSITFVSSLLRRDYKNLINQPAMQAWISKNAQLVSIIGSLAQA